MLVISNNAYAHAQDDTTVVQKKPNILIILADDVGTGDIPSYWNSSLVAMPNLDKLASMGVSFRDAHSTPLCAPSRYMLLSGNYAHRGVNIGGSWNFKGNGNQFLDSQKSIAEVLRDHGGYHTSMVGKYHLGGKIPPHGLQGDFRHALTHPEHDWSLPLIEGAQDIGFDRSYITPGGIQQPPYSFFRDGYLTTNSSDIIYWDRGSYNTTHGTTNIKEHGEGSVHWDSTAYNMILVNETASFIDDHLEIKPEDPFFVYCTLGAVHGPQSPPTHYLDGSPIFNEYKTRHMDMLLEMDKVVGSLVSIIEERNLAENTIIIFTSDNGGLRLSEQFSHRASGPLRGFKADNYEGGHRVPLIMRYDNIFPDNEERKRMVGLNDIYATICDLVGIDVPYGSAQDSVSFAKYIVSNNNDDALRQHFATWSFNQKPIIQSIRSGDLKLIYTSGESTMELYDLGSDLSETMDLSKDANYTKTIGDMYRKLVELGPCPDDYKGRFLLRGGWMQGKKKKCNWFAKKSERCTKYIEGELYCGSVCGRFNQACQQYFTTTVSTILTTNSLASVSPTPSEVPSNEIVEWVVVDM